MPTQMTIGVGDNSKMMLKRPLGPPTSKTNFLEFLESHMVNNETRLNVAVDLIGTTMSRPTQ